MKVERGNMRFEEAWEVGGEGKGRVNTKARKGPMETSFL